MFSKLLIYAVNSSLWSAIFSVIAKVPFPYHKFPLEVCGNRMVASVFDRYLALWLWKTGVLSGDEVRALSGLCKPGMFVLDVGANIGIFSLIFGKQVGSSGHVWAFEPHPGNAASLKQNVEANFLSNVTVIDKAVGRSSGTCDLFLHPFHSGDHRTYQAEGAYRSTPVDMIALDDYFSPGQRIDLVKIDVQGSELNVLTGMKRILSENHDIQVFMELWPKGYEEAGFSPEQVLNFLLDMGFTLDFVGVKIDKMSCDKISEALNLVRKSEFSNVCARR